MIGPAPLEIVPLRGHAPPDSLLDALRDRLSTFLRVPVTIAAPADLAATSAAQTVRLSSNAIVDRLIERAGGELASLGQWVLAVTDVDLHAPGREFVFGEATFAGAWAVVSSARLAYPAGTALDRLTKEAIHEIGHLAGLRHCSASHCVMRLSKSVEDIDRKEADFCHVCTSRFFEAGRS